MSDLAGIEILPDDEYQPTAWQRGSGAHGTFDRRASLLLTCPLWERDQILAAFRTRPCLSEAQREEMLIAEGVL